jgi:multidrug efflux pump subunit AcrA (membrane-fusion protein)
MRQQLLEERGRQALAKQEWEALGTADASELQKALSLREPHLKKAEAALAAAISKLEHSDLQVQRCTVRAPFDGILVDWKGHLGSQAHGQFDLGMLLDHRRFNVEVQLKKSQLHLLPSVKNIPVEFVPEKKREMKKMEKEEKKEEEKEMVEKQVSDKQWMPKGSLKSILPLHHEKGRLITALVSIENPLDSEASPLFVGDFIEARMDSLPFHNSAILPRSALGRGNHLWILNSDNSITKRDVRYSPKGDDEILVHEGIKEGEVYLEEWPEVSVEGMLVRPMSSNDSNVEK